MLEVRNRKRLPTRNSALDIIGALLIYAFIAAVIGVVIAVGIVMWALVWWTFKVNNLWGLIAFLILILITRTGTRVTINNRR